MGRAHSSLGPLELVLPALLALALLASCGAPGRGAGPLRAHIAAVEGARELGLAPGDVAEVVSRELSASPLLEVVPGAGAAARVRLARGSGDTLRLQVSLPAPEEPGFRPAGEELSATVEIAAEEGPIDPAADLPLAARRAAAVLETRLLLARGRREDVGRVLMADDPGILALALEWVLEHDPRAWAPDCLPLVRHRDPTVAGLAIAVVGRGGDPNLAEALIDAAAGGDPGTTRQLYEALGHLGGPRALSFLRMAARNEDDPQLARAAQEALDRAERAPLAEVALPGTRGKIRRGHR